MKQKFLNCFFLLIIIFSNFNISNSNQLLNFDNITSNSTLQSTLKSSVQVLLPGILSFIAAAISSAGGIGGGGLFIPILTIVAALELKTASTYSAFMVTGGSIANVACHMFYRRSGKKQLIDYDIALLSEPCMLLGVSCGVICNLVLPEWLITVIFVIFLGFCTFKTCKSGILFWKLESEGLRTEMENEIEDDDSDDGSTKVPLLRTELSEGKMGIPWMKIGILLLIWFSFFLFNLLRGNRYGQGIINIKPCGTGYWTISSIQIPLAVVFTTLILYIRKKPKRHQENIGPNCSNSSQKAIFPIMALLAGILGGVFGIGGGMLISPLLLQIGIEPKVTAATCSFMVLFSSSMSAVQYLLLGMDHLSGALAYAAICFIGSLVGLTLVQQAIMKHGRASLIVFSVGTVMALSTVLITSFGAVDVWNDYISGKSMGFKRPC